MSVCNNCDNDCIQYQKALCNMATHTNIHTRTLKQTHSGGSRVPVGKPIIIETSEASSSHNLAQQHQKHIAQFITNKDPMHNM